MKRPRSNPPRPNPALESAARALGMRRPDEAERLAGAVLKADRGNLEAGRLLGIALLAQDRPGEAVEPLQRAARRGEDPTIETLLARALAGTGRLEEALDQWRLATTRRPAFAQAFADLGDRLGEQGRFDEAVATFEAGLALRPGDAVLQLGLGYIHVRRNERAEARALFSQAMAAAPERGDAAVALARVMALDGEYAAAAELYRNVLRGRPEDGVARIELGKCLLELGEREAGEAMLRGAASGGAPGSAVKALAATPHGRFFLRPSAAARFLGGG